MMVIRGKIEAADGGQIVGSACHQIADLVVLEIVEFELFKVLEEIGAQIVLDLTRCFGLPVASVELKDGLDDG